MNDRRIGHDIIFWQMMGIYKLKYYPLPVKFIKIIRGKNEPFNFAQEPLEFKPGRNRASGLTCTYCIFLACEINPSGWRNPIGRLDNACRTSCAQHRPEAADLSAPD
jgi:hypothetical protein